MNHGSRHFILWIVFVILISLGFLELASLEKASIPSGQMPQNGFILIQGFLFAIIIYPATFFLLSIYLQRWIRHWYVFLLTFSIAGAAMGRLVIYPMLFPSIWEDKYNLSPSIAIFLFGAAGFIYALFYLYTNNRLDADAQISRASHIMSIIVCMISLSIISYHLYSKYTYNMHKGEHGELFKQEASPDKGYIAKAYGFPYGGAAGGVNVRVDVLSAKGDFKKTIYYGHWYNNFEIEWQNNKKLHIENKPDIPENLDRSITLNVFKQIYDEDGTACESLVMKGKYEECYQY